MAARTLQMPPAPSGAERPVILARVYPGTHEAAVEFAQQDAEALVAYGYYPVAQSYAEGRYSNLAIALAVVLSLFGIGLFFLLVMAAVRPVGTLAVTYERRDAGVTSIR
jgi:hypothetical protein